MRFTLAYMLVFFASFAAADIVVPTQTIRSNTVLTAADLAIKAGSVAGTVADPAMAIGKETRVVLYAGRPIRLNDLMEPAIVKRNQIVPLVFKNSGLSISTAGRALDRGAAGDIVRVMNMSSRTTLFGTVMPDGRIDVSSM